MRNVDKRAAKHRNKQGFAANRRVPFSGQKTELQFCHACQFVCPAKGMDTWSLQTERQFSRRQTHCAGDRFGYFQQHNHLALPSWVDFFSDGEESKTQMQSGW